MSLPLMLITRLFQLISERKFTEAERVLERVKSKMERNGQKDFNQGYLTALNGIILTNKSGNEASYEFFANINLNDVNALKKHYKDFLEKSESRFLADYDRGYFSALCDYMRVALRTAQRNAPNKDV
jgi:ATP/maltotriose-dependent transcriptional regulator MalT